MRTSVKVAGRVLYLTQDEDLLRGQLHEGRQLELDPDRPLIDNISTDEITPGWVCYYYDETLARYCLVGLRGDVVEKDAIKNGGFGVIVSGISKGCGSSRETAPFSELKAGVQLVIAKSIEKIYGQNCQNIGLLTSTDFGLVERVQRGEEIPIAEFTKGLDPISAAIVERGGLFDYNKARLAGAEVPPVVDTAPRPMTLCEKIIARRAIADARTGATGIAAVQPGDALFVRTDVRFSHEYVTPMAESLFRMGLGDEAAIKDPESVFAFRDHLTFLDRVMPQAHVKLGLREQAASLATVQEKFVRGQGVKLYGEVVRDGKEAGSVGICHNIVIEELAWPGQVVVGTDSHTCMAGALGCFAFGVGSTDMANAWFTKDVRVRVPETARINLRGSLPEGVCAKDVMLYLLSDEFFKSGDGIGKVLEFAGDGVVAMPMDERATLTNMAVEAGSFTGIIEADDVAVEYLREMRGVSADEIRSGIVTADSELGEKVQINIAYGGSCTGGKKADMDMYASVVRRATDKGLDIADGVDLYIQFGSQKIRDYAESMGYVQLFQQAGVSLIDPSCGACIKAGPGVSTDPDQVTVSAINRNFPGRSGPGEVYLASPLVVAASAFLGYVGGPEEL
jgi:3-isopropylmalate/(R)-2-methylmalate dehydratase large subunit